MVTVVTHAFGIVFEVFVRAACVGAPLGLRGGLEGIGGWMDESIHGCLRENQRFWSGYTLGQYWLLIYDIVKNINGVP